MQASGKWLRHAWGWALLGAVAALALADEDYVPADALREAGLIRSWQLRLPLDKGQRVVDLYRVDDQLYAATLDGCAYAVHADTGAMRWMRQITAEGYRLRAPVHAGERVIWATPTTVLQLDRLTGEGAARWTLSFPAGTGPATDGVRVFLGGLDQRAYAFDVQNRLRGWQALTQGPVTSTPALAEGHLFVASSDGTVYSCTADRKAFRWRTTTYGSITADLVASKQGVYVANRDQSLYLLDELFGQVAWRARFSGPLYEPPVLAGDAAFQYCPDDGLAAVNTGVVGVAERIRWKLPRGRFLLTVDAERAYVLSQDQTILIASLAQGEVVHTLPAKDLTLAAPCPDHTAIYVGGADGRLICLRPRGTPLVTQGDVHAALGEPQTQPAEAGETAAASMAGEKEEDRLTTGRKGLPLGGKSKVSKNYGKGEPAGGGK